jgi:hypothetical protein
MKRRVSARAAESADSTTMPPSAYPPGLGSASFGSLFVLVPAVFVGSAGQLDGELVGGADAHA